MNDFGCRAVSKMIRALFTDTTSSIGECMTSSAASRVEIRSHCGCIAMSSRNWRRTRNGRPPIDTVASPASTTGSRVAQQSDDVEGVGRCTDGDDPANLGDLRCGCQDCRPAQRMPDQYRWGTELVTEMVCGAHQVLDVGTEAGRGEVTLGLPQAGEVEPQYRDALTRQRTRDPACCNVVLAAGEAVREQCPGFRGVTRHLQLAGQLSATAAEDRSG